MACLGHIANCWRSQLASGVARHVSAAPTVHARGAWLPPCLSAPRRTSGPMRQEGPGPHGKRGACRHGPDLRRTRGVARRSINGCSSALCRRWTQAGLTRSGSDSAGMGRAARSRFSAWEEPPQHPNQAGREAAGSSLAGSQQVPGLRPRGYPTRGSPERDAAACRDR